MLGLGWVEEERIAIHIPHNKHKMCTRCGRWGVDDVWGSRKGMGFNRPPFRYYPRASSVPQETKSFGQDNWDGGLRGQRWGRLFLILYRSSYK